MAPQTVPRASILETSSSSWQGVGRQRHSLFCVPSTQGWGDEVRCDSVSQGTAAAALGLWEGTALTQVPFHP